MVISYILCGNSEQLKESDLPEFLSNFHYLFTAKVMPSYNIIREFCSSIDSRLDDGRISWVPFEVKKNDYCIAKPKLINMLGLDDIKIPNNIDNAYKWMLWQFEITHGVPYEEYKILADVENNCLFKLEKAISAGDVDQEEKYQLEYLDACKKVGDFLHPYLVLSQ